MTAKFYQFNGVLTSPLQKTLRNCTGGLLLYLRLPLSAR
jgi:hypothetical protein